VTPLAIGFLRLASWRLPGIPDLETHKRQNNLTFERTDYDTTPSTSNLQHVARCHPHVTEMSKLRYQTAKPRVGPAEVQCV
jgi:hypothetical protein